MKHWYVVPPCLQLLQLCCCWFGMSVICSCSGVYVFFVLFRLFFCSFVVLFVVCFGVIQLFIFCCVGCVVGGFGVLVFVFGVHVYVPY